jgi:DNA (cytosine-5)-methyltransferase 1
MIKIFWIDLFSGAGGTTTGIHLVDQNNRVKVVACVNHDSLAIESHKANHPDCIHFIEDVRDLNVVIALAKLLKQLRRDYPGCRINIWASLECTNYSKAKGGLPRDADSRTLAHAMYMYLEHLDPDYFFVENVREFMAWGPLDDKGRPVSKLNGRDYIRWCKKIQSFGYRYDWQLLNAADFGAYTSRERYFGQFAKRDLPISWPEPTHTKKPFNGGLFASLAKWKPVKEVLDLKDEGRSIFDRKKPLSEKTLERVYAGLIKFVAGGKDLFLSHYYGNGFNTSTDEPCPTLRTKDSVQKVQAQFMDQQFGTGSPASINRPLGTITTVPKYNLVSCSPWIMDTSFSNVGSSIDKPVGVITASRKQHYLMNPQYSNPGGSVDKPCFTLIARMDKKPPHLVCADKGKSMIAINESDSVMSVKIKEFMILYGISDIRMRMLKVVELLRIQGFPEEYILKGPKSQQKKFIGNAVETTVARKIAEANAYANISDESLAV